jgi:4-carboxymuconolactone decarboxylase
MKTVKDYCKIYEELLGYSPPRVEERLRLGLDIDPELVDMVENLRAKAMYPKEFDVKTSQLMLFAILLAQMLPGAHVHALAAVRAGATKAELHAVVALTYLFRGIPAFNSGAEIIAKVFEKQQH